METVTYETETFEPAATDPCIPAAPKVSVLGLVRNLTGEFKTFIRQEIDLAKTEASEKVSMIGKNAVSIAIGGFVAYAGLIVLLIGLGWLLGFAFTRAGLDPALATFLGLVVIGLVVALIGAAFIFKALSVFKKESMAPQRTLHTLKELKGGEKMETANPKEHDQEEEMKFSSEELEDQVEQTEYQMGQTLDELGRRLSPKYINARIKGRLQRNPYRAGLVAIAAGVISGLLLRRKFQHA
jgi:Putative Actinobacterial Holin-X, holin superfamily III/Protein of unknown function (DUF3618)